MNTPDKVEEIVKKFEEKQKSLFTQGGLAVLLDYPPHDKVLDEKLVTNWLRTSLTQYHQDLMSEVVEKIWERQKGWLGEEEDGSDRDPRYDELEEIKTIIKSLTPPIKSDER